MKNVTIVITTALFVACASLQPRLPLNPASAVITADDLLKHIKILASDEFEGRLPGTRGEEKTVAYLTEQFKELGLEPGNPDGSYVQNVPLVGINGTPSAELKVAGRKQPFKLHKDYIAVTTQFKPSVSVKDSEVVFVGYGIQAPEYGWDDYKGLDVRGKTLVMLINDPAGDEALFKGKAMTYYGRWTYKYEIAARLGAAAAIIVHEDGPAGYPWAVVDNGSTGEQFELATADKNAGNVPVQAWITRDKAVQLFKADGVDFETLKQEAQSADFVPTLLDAKVSFNIRNKVRHVQSRNVVARLPGSDPKLADEHLIYTAHWDHLGRDRKLKGDPIYNGAVDNASGTAGLLELADAFTELTPAPKRSILFLAVTAEEQGLLGSAHYAANPLYPLTKTVGVINMDSLNPWGPTREMQAIGYGQNTLEDVLTEVAASQGRVVVGDTQTEKGFYYRSDQFNFAKQGVPALYADGGNDVIGKPAGWGAEKGKEFTRNDYHKPSDEVKLDWDLSGAAQDMQLLFEVGLRVADTADVPVWKAGSEFKAIREKSLAK
ncbi:MAG: M28 family metallopeptidase [Pseudomonadota bacterium]